MKKIALLSLLWISLLNCAKNDSTQDLEAYFSAIIVSDIEVSINWYKDILGFDIENKIESEERGFKQSNLKRGSVHIELIELNKAVSLKEIIPEYNNKTRIVGLFKIGFHIRHFDKWMDHLATRKVDKHGDIVSDSKTGKRMIIITDPDGNRIQLFEK